MKAIDKVKETVEAYRAHDEDASCGEIAKIVLGELTKHGHHAVLVDDGAHVYVYDYNLSAIVDFARDLSDKPGEDVVVEKNDASVQGYKLPTATSQEDYHSWLAGD